MPCGGQETRHITTLFDIEEEGKTFAYQYFQNKKEEAFAFMLRGRPDEEANRHGIQLPENRRRNDGAERGAAGHA